MFPMQTEEMFIGLNEAQLEAIQHPLGVPAMVLAGAGSGKTRVLTTRAAYLLTQHHVRPERILLVTFTNKASAEMVERLQRMVGIGLPFAGTFHRIAARILRAHGRYIGVDPGFTIFDEDDQLSLMTTIIKELGLSTKETKPRSILGAISSAKNELLTPAEYAQIAKGRFQETVARLYPLYQKRLERNNAVDFDDLIMKVIELLQTHEEIRSHYQHQFEHILIDEYQDTNTAQYILTKLLVKPQMNLFVVGDFSQAIYGWRGADYRNMLALKDDFPDIVTYKLEQNYRSTQPILDAASGVISYNTSHPVLELWTQNQEGEQVHLFEAARDSDEVEHVMKMITMYSREYELNDMVILYRTNAQSRVFEEALLARGIPYRLVGGVRFYERKEIKDIVCLLRLFVYASDELARKRIEKLGKKKLANYLNWIEMQKNTFLSSRTLKHEVHEGYGIQEKEAQEKLESKEKDPKVDFDSIMEISSNPNEPTSALTLLDAILQATAYLEQFDPHDEEDASRLENIQELRSLAAQFSDIPSLLETIALVEQEALNREQQSSSGINLMSVHAAKGLEFSIVFLVGMEEGLFPHSRSLLDKLQMEEERRLCYVAITRAKKQLHISYAHRRLVFGTVSGSIVSRFISEIPSSVVTKEGGVQFPFTSSFSRPSVVPPKPTRRIVPLDDPSIDDFLEGNIDVDTFLGA
ncbi:ATP-dependent DNA helicase PcrA [Candidatus Cerribacteria bacterium 'Amazon FNV 2010 28 9']|uniref:DNA 3'-5' helicase n=1 Tax=Candidatus Cerribacteria bacterium 'Amazon FNV 2010 28 9' TaxID=2081795 RepID=A0A317JNJ4_9BACT|nr:MAG: ATP-dependent DNA helicase PcrA [Candidatus Cerribacteria bacterium 'Amazon FNV 2010 28 9']